MLKFLIIASLLVSLESAPMTPMGFPMLEKNGFFNSKPLFGYLGKFKVKAPDFDSKETMEENNEVTTAEPEQDTFPNWYLSPLNHDLRPLSRVFLGRRSN